MIVAGIMSGTSLDGISVSIVEITGHGWDKKVRTLAHGSSPYPKPVREALLGVSKCDTHTTQIGFLNFLLPELYAKAVKRLCAKSKIPLSKVQLAGSHGQTILHVGAPTSFLNQRLTCTLQIGDGGVLDERRGMPAVSDFRTRDMAAGGQGAPLVPYVDYLLVRDKKIGRIALNIGGIGNVTAIPAGAPPSKVIAFDTGPGNMVMDQLVTHFTRGRRHFDRDGAAARKGKASRWLLRILLRDPFFRKAPPKSAGREEYGSELIEYLVNTHLSFEDLVATAAAFTVVTIADGVRRHVLPHAPMEEMYVSGGGVHNPVLMESLARDLHELKVRPISDLGIDPDGKEALAFAVMAYETFHGRPSNMPSATRAQNPVIQVKISTGSVR